MRKLYRILLGLMVLIVITLGVWAVCPHPEVSVEGVDIRPGDVVFQALPSFQSAALEVVTKSIYTHVGMVFEEEDGTLMVYEAVQPVRRIPLERWLARGRNEHYVVKRWVGADALDGTTLETMREEARGMLGKNYDFQFMWDDRKIYCSELVWKVYERGAGVELAELERYSDMELDHPLARAQLAWRFPTGNVPVEERIITPVRLFESPLLQEVSRGGEPPRGAHEFDGL